MIRKSTFLLGHAGFLIVLLMMSAIDAIIRGDRDADKLNLMRQQVAGLELTDLSLFTEARYTRHLSQSDLHTAFQDHPFAFEHFPSGSLVMPPVIKTRRYETANPETALSD